jgi:cyanophycin synthetase
MESEAVPVAVSPDAWRPIVVREARVLDGPNAWSARPVVWFLVDGGDAGDEGGRFGELMAQLEPQGGDGSWGELDLGSMLESMVSEMQALAGDAIAYHHSRAAAEAGWYEVVCEFDEPELALAAASLGVRMLNALLFQTEPEFRFDRAFDQEIMALVRARIGHTDDAAVVQAARRRGIPVRIVGPERRLIELGSGVHLRRFRRMVSSETSHLGARISSNKWLTNQLLEELGLPVPPCLVARRLDEALGAAEQIGYPVVVKPLNGYKGQGVSTDLRTPDDLRKAFPAAIGATRLRTTVIERFIPGREYRILVIGGEVAAVVEREPAKITGDGAHSVRELIDSTNTHPWRGPGADSYLASITIDDATIAALAQQDMTLESVPEAGRDVRVKLVSNISQGGMPVDRTRELHPDTARMAVMASQAIGIDLCGLDLITPDISLPLWEVGGAFIEVNHEPGVRMHLPPHREVPRDVGTMIIESLFPPDRPVRVPVVAVAGAQGAGAVCAALGRIAREAGYAAGVATSREHVVDGLRMARPDLVGRPHHRLVLQNPVVDCAIVQVQPEQVEREGLAFAVCDVAIVTRMDDRDPAGPRPVEWVLLEAAGTSGTAVLDANDPRIAELLDRAPAEVILFGAEPDARVMRGHVARGGRAVVALPGAGGRVAALLEGSGRADLGPVVDGPEAAWTLAAMAGAVALGAPAEVIRRASEGLADG